jgi:thiamine-phosphate pyrophosphorylase
MICMVTDRRRLSAGADAGERLVDLVAAAARSGVDLIQLRERDLDARDLVVLARRCVVAVEGTSTRVVVNDRADVALAAGAHGVHLRGDSIDTAAIRSLLRGDALVGRSIHTAAEASAIARRGGVNYLIFGTMFETPSKNAQHRLRTVGELEEACQAAPGIPVLAIGGMTIERAEHARRAGASGIAGIGLFIPPAGQRAAPHLQGLVAALRRTFDTCEAVT